MLETTSRTVAVMAILAVLLISLGITAALAGASITGTTADRDSFNACVAAGRSPSECNLAIFGRAR